MKKITQKDGKPVSKGYAQTPCMGDWDGDGDYDMALGVISGPVKLYLNNGDLTFTEAGDFTVNGKPITASDGGPCVVDWDGDGVLDLLLGDGQGSVDFYPGTGRGARELRAKETIIKADANGGWQPRKPSKNPAMPFTPAQPGVRTKPFAADWNNDGKLDLLVGDFLQIEQPAPKLTAAQKKQLAKLREQRSAVMKRMQEAGKRLEARVQKVTGLKGWDDGDDEQRRKYSDTYMAEAKKDKDYERVSREYSDLYMKISKLEPRAEPTGVVWVYLRK